MMPKLLLLILLTMLGACSFFIEKIDTPLVQKVNTSIESSRPTFCSLEQNVKLQLVGSNRIAESTYADLISSMGGERLDFLDHLALWTLLQLSIRPDQTSATSRFQVLLSYEGKTHYFDFFSELTDGQYPLFYGLEWILKKFGKKNVSLERYEALLQKNLGSRLKIGKSFENFLLKNQEAIKADPDLNKHYFRGSQILRENETIPPLALKEIIKTYRKSTGEQRIIINTYLTPFSTTTGANGSCNYDFNLYDNSIFLIDRVIPVANLFGLSIGKDSFMASSSQKIEKFESLLGTPLFKGNSKVRSSAVCVIESEKNKIWTFSNQSRDPGQHLFHLVRYGLPSAQSVYDVDRLIRHSRHLFLSDPVRLIIESDRSREDQIENLLKLNLPIYNSDKLGNIWSWVNLDDTSRFIIDDRNSGAYLCK